MFSRLRHNAIGKVHKVTFFFLSYKFNCYFCDMKKTIFNILLLALLMAACGNSYDEQKRLSRAERARLHREDSLALKIAVLPTMDCLPLYVAKERVMYDTARVDLRLRHFAAQADCDTAFCGRSVEGMVSDLVRTERLRSRGVKPVYVASTNAYWLLVANRKARIKSVAQLGDKMVAMSRHSATDCLTGMALEGVRTSSVVFRIQVDDVNIRLAMLLNNEMDAAWLTEPMASVAVAAGHNVIADSRKMRQRLGVLAFRADAAADARRRRQIDAMTVAYNAACDSLNAYGPAHYADVLAKYYRIDAGAARALPKLRYVHAAPPSKAEVTAADKAVTAYSQHTHR